jgi:hypothetical protein
MNDVFVIGSRYKATCSKPSRLFAGLCRPLAVEAFEKWACRIEGAEYIRDAESVEVRHRGGAPPQSGGAL